MLALSGASHFACIEPYLERFTCAVVKTQLPVVRTIYLEVGDDRLTVNGYLWRFCTNLLQLQESE